MFNEFLFLSTRILNFFRTNLIVNVVELKDYLFEKMPLAVYHTDIDIRLECVISKYRIWNDWYGNVDKIDEKKHYFHRNTNKFVSIVLWQPISQSECLTLYLFLYNVNETP